MGVMDFFKRAGAREHDSELHKFVACAKGKVIPLAEVKDEVFASGVLGKGCGIIPESGDIFSPVSGTVEMIFPTKHAIGIKTAQGVEALIHIGINTVEIDGKGFQSFVKQGDKVSKGQLLESVDLKGIIEAGYDPTVMLIITGMGDYNDVILKDDMLVLVKEN